MNLKLFNLSITLICLLSESYATGQITVHPGFRIAEVENSSGLGPIAIFSNEEIFAARGFFGNQSIVRLNRITGVVSHFVVGVKDTNDNEILDGGISSIGDVVYDPNRESIYFTDNFELGTVFVATDIDGDGQAVSILSQRLGQTPEVVPLAPIGRIPFATSILSKDQSCDCIYVGNAVGGGAGELIKVGLDSTVEVLATGFDYTAGIAMHPITGDLYLGNSSFPDSGTIYRLIEDVDGSGVIEISNPLEAELVLGGLPGPSDLLFDGNGTLFISTSGSDVVYARDTDNDLVPDTVEILANGFSFSSSMDFYPSDGTLVANQLGGILFVSDPFASDPVTHTIKTIQGLGAPKRRLYSLNAFGEITVLQQ